MFPSTKAIRLACLVGGLFISQQTAFGQSQQRWSFGPRLGVNFSNLTGGDYGTSVTRPNGTFISRSRYLPGVSVGLGALYSSRNRFGLGIDLLFSQRGDRTDVVAPGVSLVQTDRLNYIEAPVTFRYFLTKSGNFRPNLYVGPVFSALVSAVLYDNQTDLRIRHNADFKPLELGATAGAQLNFRLGERRRLTIDGRYTRGLTDLQTSRTGTYNQFFTLGLGYNFGVGPLY